MLCAAALCYGIASVVAEFLYCSAELFVIFLVAVCPLDGLPCLFHQFHLHLAVLFDLFVGELDGFKHFRFAYLLHFTLDHHDVVVCGGNHKVDVGISHLAEIRVYLQLSVDSCDTDFRDRSLERDVAYRKCG